MRQQQPALHAKLSTLSREFDDLRAASSTLEAWNTALWESNTVQLADWCLLDAWYRSRVLELPRSGPSLVPCIDMANHAAAANAYYEETTDGDVVLLLREGSAVRKGEEITISYGSDKSAAEMLFSYGFLDASSSALQSLTLPLSPLPDDPLGMAKMHIHASAQYVQLKTAFGGMVEWTSPFAYLVCLNEEDGLEFKVRQSSDGERELRVFWQEEDVTDKAREFEALAGNHELGDVFRLRVNMLISQRLQEQLDRLSYTDSAETGEVQRRESLSFCAANCRELKRIETAILDSGLAALGEQVSPPPPFSSGCALKRNHTECEIGRETHCLLLRASRAISTLWDRGLNPNMRPMRKISTTSSAELIPSHVILSKNCWSAAVADSSNISSRIEISRWPSAVREMPLGRSWG